MVAIFLVSFELRTLGKDYKGLFGYIQKFAHCHGHASCWLIESRSTAARIRDGAMKHIDGSDDIFVARLSMDWAGVRKSCGDWLNSPTRNWHISADSRASC